jgi:hypothetical protein
LSSCKESIHHDLWFTLDSAFCLLNSLQETPAAKKIKDALDIDKDDFVQIRSHIKPFVSEKKSTAKTPTKSIALNLCDRDEDDFVQLNNSHVQASINGTVTMCIYLNVIELNLLSKLCYRS